MGPLSKGPYARFAHLNWTGDWARYASFAAVSGRPLSFLLPLYVVAINLHSKALHDAVAVQHDAAKTAKLAEKRD